MFEKNEVRDLDLPSQKKFCAQDTSLDVLGKAFVVHGYDGGRIACGTLEYCDPCGPPPPPANVCKPWCKNNPEKHCPKTQLCGGCYFCYH